MQQLVLTTSKWRYSPFVSSRAIARGPVPLVDERARSIKSELRAGRPRRPGSRWLAARRREGRIQSNRAIALMSP